MLEKVKEIIAKQLNLDVDEITESTSFKDDLGADSLDLFELVMAFEEEYDIEIHLLRFPLRTWRTLQRLAISSN